MKGPASEIKAIAFCEFTSALEEQGLAIPTLAIWDDCRDRFITVLETMDGHSEFAKPALLAWVAARSKAVKRGKKMPGYKGDLKVMRKSRRAASNSDGAPDIDDPRIKDPPIEDLPVQVDKPMPLPVPPNSMPAPAPPTRPAPLKPAPSKSAPMKPAVPVKPAPVKSTATKPTPMHTTSKHMPGPSNLKPAVNKPVAPASDTANEKAASVVKKVKKAGEGLDDYAMMETDAFTRKQKGKWKAVESESDAYTIHESKPASHKPKWFLEPKAECIVISSDSEPETEAVESKARTQKVQHHKQAPETEGMISTTMSDEAMPKVSTHTLSSITVYYDNPVMKPRSKKQNPRHILRLPPTETHGIEMKATESKQHIEEVQELEKKKARRQNPEELVPMLMDGKVQHEHLEQAVTEQRGENAARGDAEARLQQESERERRRRVTPDEKTTQDSLYADSETQKRIAKLERSLEDLQIKRARAPRDQELAHVFADSVLRLEDRLAELVSQRVEARLQEIEAGRRRQGENPQAPERNIAPDPPFPGTAIVPAPQPPDRQAAPRPNHALSDSAGPSSSGPWVLRGEQAKAKARAATQLTEGIIAQANCMDMAE